jgi:DNA invertase Pin-like site-specific DNA recombinase
MHYDDGGYTGGNMDRPALQELFKDIEAGQIDMVVVYKIDRLSRSLFDFSKIVELFEKHSVGFVSVTQAFNTSTSSGKLMLNMFGKLLVKNQILARISMKIGINFVG